MTRNKKPFFSVIIPTYNSETFIERALKSVFNQTFSDFEVIIVDNSSKDSTINIINSFNKNNTTILKVKNNGIISYSRNRGVEIAKGNWISFLDSDDTWKENKLECVKEAIDKNKSGFIISHHEHVIQKNKIIKTLKLSTTDSDIYRALLFKGNFFSPSAITIKKSIYTETKGFNEKKEFSTAEDYEYWLRLAEYKDFRYSQNNRFIFINKVLGACHLHDYNMSKKIHHHVNASIFVRESHLQKWKKKFPNNKNLISQTRAALWINAANALRQNHEFKYAIQYVLKGLKFNPFRLKGWVVLVFSLTQYPLFRKKQ